MAITTLGRQMVKNALPQKYRGRVDRAWTNDVITRLTTQIAKDDPDAYVDVLQALDKLGQQVVSQYGRQAGITIQDLNSGKSVKNSVAKFQQLMRGILDDPRLSNEQKQQRIVDLGYKYSQSIKNAVVQDHKVRNTALYAQMLAGARGNPMQLTQLNFGNLGVRDAVNRDMPYFSASPYAQGASPFACWVGASSSRKGFYDTQALTGRAGYLGKQASNATHNVPIIQEDCKTQNTGIVVPADGSAVGAILLRPFKRYPAGSIVTQDMIQDSDDADQLIVRSPITCLSHHGVCARCSGLNQSGRFSTVGQYVALNSAKTFIQKATQAGVGSKHTGGTGGKKVEDPEGQDQPTGMDSLQRLFYIPSTFKGGSVLSSVDGRVNEIRKAPQGGHYITVGTTTLYSPQARKVLVKQGDMITAGDRLTNGIPNPAQIVKYKGLGQGRRYFIGQLDRTLKQNKWGVQRRNLQQFSRSFLDKVRITSDDGLGQALPGDIVDYSTIQAEWTPRQGTKQQSAKDSLNMYLQEPMLHYTIGTRVTPAVRDTLVKYKFDKIKVHPEPPPFQDVMVRSQDIVSNDENWLPRMMGQRLTATLFNAARRGTTDRHDSPSYVDKVIVAPYKPQG